MQEASTSMLWEQTRCGCLASHPALPRLPPASPAEAPEKGWGPAGPAQPQEAVSPYASGSCTELTMSFIFVIWGFADPGTAAPPRTGEFRDEKKFTRGSTFQMQSKQPRAHPCPPPPVQLALGATVPLPKPARYQTTRGSSCAPEPRGDPNQPVLPC